MLTKDRGMNGTEYSYSLTPRGHSERPSIMHPRPIIARSRRQQSCNSPGVAPHARTADWAGKRRGEEKRRPNGLRTWPSVRFKLFQTHTSEARLRVRVALSRGGVSRLPAYLVSTTSQASRPCAIPPSCSHLVAGSCRVWSLPGWILSLQGGHRTSPSPTPAKTETHS